MKKEDKPKVGVGVIILDKEGKVLIGKRKGSHAPYYSIPGGSLDFSETFEGCARREVKEEANLSIKDPQVIAVTNNLETSRKEGVHYISVILLAKGFSGDLKIMETDKCEQWLWADPNNLPRPHFDASARAIKSYLAGKFYIKLE
ncbi:ADP-ribose pyrophosphatase [Candidatus Kuenenbacteria bacterium CG_4_9_14_3_um_filter_39_14]|uniref:ADP-ribose pyrophosphatase n=3 Tax=Candidatus Kueneniibacteriota TaxID=1752740 RepID=A0A2M7MH92_9BACT|nr:MAG: ADP-ribose pyrophosphatase [Candidatus Kuenenbacteria bacterium CG22_combo_CG10-13_8_21_14_all_39_9]PIX92472.1 MAG: ADP-ribose pyrophosphatase [Candidatus Kuenenbacteria bacterium CG_4_10_14_3_um_filter_39_14]PJA92119.1 MAG: ADP-ribose pyrophosphatase [Candidatus Kuenenbacteria bacterium CG_4_9_14_3_um_filter_39_14]